MGRQSEVLTTLRRTRQIRQFTDDPVADDDLREILNVARWSGSSANWQPWRFHVIRDRDTLARLAELAPSARHVAGAAVVIAIQMPGEKATAEAFDEGRVAERILVAAGALGLGAALGWVMGNAREDVADLLGLTPPTYVRSMVAIGHPTPDARRPKTAPGQAREPLSELVIDH